MHFPIFYENSKLPKLLSFFAPITIKAITIGPLVFSDGEMSDITKNHERIHWEQYKELYIIGFLVLYFYYWLVGLRKHKSGSKAYLSIPFEREAYANHEDMTYTLRREKQGWKSYIK